MTEPLIFSMSGAPRGKGRPRATVRGGHATTYTDPKTRAYEQSVAAIARKAMKGRPPLEGALSVSLRFRLALPKSMSKRERAAILAGERPYFGRIDCDNAAKSLLDGCNTIVWRDDVQITRLFVVKEAAEAPGVDVKVTPLEPQESPAWSAA
jgi:Holliday junction resolvase RusA-like endonuclease